MLDIGLVERFHQKYEKSEGGCWNWTASLAGKGYGQIKLPRERKQIYAHRLAYWIATGKRPPDRMHVCHTCDNPRCVNPDHLFIGTSQDNHDDMVNKGRSTRGDRNAMAVLTDQKIREIRALFSVGKPVVEVAAMYGIHPVHASKIKRGILWNHVT